MAAPLLVGLALGTVMGFTAGPLEKRLARRLNHRRKLASIVTTLLGGLIMAGGGALAVWIVAREIAAAGTTVQRLMGPEGPSLIGPRAQHILAALGIHREVIVDRLRADLGRVADYAGQAARFLVQASAGAVLTLIVALWTMYSVLSEWPAIERHLERILPLDPRDTRALVGEFRQVGRSAFVGTVAGGIVTGVLAGTGFAIFGVPQPVTWGALMAVTSLIPVVGVPMVWVPMAVWLLASGHFARAMGLTAWSLIIVMALMDYVIRPMLVGGRKAAANPLLTLVALLGGVSVFGIAGVIVGPVIMSLFLASARIYESERELELRGKETEAPPQSAR
jgi:predicted PurR-regulated permease PerM